MKILMGTLLTLCLALSGLAWAASVNINTADAATLAAELDGIGSVRARSIVEYRETHGPFARVDELMRVSGVGRRVLEMNRDRIRIEDADEGGG